MQRKTLYSILELDGIPLSLKNLLLKMGDCYSNSAAFSEYLTFNIGSLKNCAKKGADKFMAKCFPWFPACSATLIMESGLTVKKNPENKVVEGLGTIY